MSAETKTTADAILKEDYQPLIRDQINNANRYSAQLKRERAATSGREALLALKTSYNEGVGALAENASLPASGTTGWTNEKVPTYTNAGRFEITAQLMAAAASDPTSFVRGVAAKTDDLRQSLARDYNRQLFGTSNGVILQLTTTSASTTVQLNSSVTNVQRRQLRAGMKIDIGTVASPATVATVTVVTAPVPDGTTFVVDSAVTTTASHFVFRSGAGGAIGGAGQKEITGLQSIVKSSGTLHNVDPSSFPLWVSTEQDTVGSISETKLNKLFDDVDVASGQFPSLVVTSYGVERAYGAVLQTYKRTVNQVDMNGGYKGLEINTPYGVGTLTTDRDCPNSTLFALNMSHMTEFVNKDWEFADDAGSVLRFVADKLNYESIIYKIAEQATDQRNSHGLMTGITEA